MVREMYLFAEVVSAIIKPSRTELSYISAIFTSAISSVLDENATCHCQTCSPSLALLSLLCSPECF